MLKLFRPFLRFIHLISLLCLGSIALLTPGCGGGGGDDDDEFLGAALAFIDTNPSKIDTGDRSLVTVEISEVHENGIALKIRFPSALSYVIGTSLLHVRGTEIDVTPTVHTTVDSNVFLVYYFSQSIFGSDIEGTLSLELEGVEAIEEGEIEVDPDVDDTEIANDVEFNPENPEFGAEDSASIEVTE